MKDIRLRFVLTALFAVMVLASGCGSSATPSPASAVGLDGPGNSTPAPGQSEPLDFGDESLGPESTFQGGVGSPGPVPEGLVDPCKLATLQEMSSLTGIPIVSATRDENEDGTFVACNFWAADQQDVPELSVELYPYDESWMDAYKEDIDGGGYQTLTGIGDVAEVYATSGPLEPSDGAGKKGNIWFSVSNSGGGNGRPSGQDQAIALLRLIASRLP